MDLKTVIIIGLSLLVALIGLDVYLAVDGHPGNTWSEILRSWAKATPVVPWVCGVLTGHFYHPDLEAIVAPPGNIVLLVWLTVLIGMVGIACARSGNPVPPFIALFPGIVAGALLWPV